MYNGYHSKNNLVNILNSNKLKLAKSRGQNYIISKNHLDKISDAIDTESYDLVIEIGTGLGALSTNLAQKSKLLITYEIDKGICEFLKEQELSNNIILRHEDFLKASFTEEKEKYKNILVCGNIPYNISSPIIEKILSEKLSETAYFLVQKEFANRLLADINTKDYSSFSVIMQTIFNVEKLFNIDRNAFYPIPEVESTFIKIELKKNIEFIYENLELYKQIVHTSFSMRRKKLINNLKKLDIDFDIKMKYLMHLK